MSIGEWKRLGVLAVAGVGIALLFAAGDAEGQWTKAPADARPMAIQMAAGNTGAEATTAAAGALARTVTKGACVRIYCSVDCRYIVGSGDIANPAADTGNPLPSKTPERFCMPSGYDRIEVWMTAAGALSIGEIVNVE